MTDTRQALDPARRGARDPARARRHVGRGGPRAARGERAARPARSRRRAYPNDAYCTPELKAIVRRVAGACGLLDGGGGRGCQPLSGEEGRGALRRRLQRASSSRWRTARTSCSSTPRTPSWIPAARALVEKAWSDQRGASFFFVVSRASTDGDEQYNEALSRDRAKAVLDHLDQKLPRRGPEEAGRPALAGRGVRAALRRVLQLEPLALRLVQPRGDQPQRLRRLDRLCDSERRALAVAASWGSAPRSSRRLPRGAEPTAAEARPGAVRGRSQAGRHPGDARRARSARRAIPPAARARAATRPRHSARCPAPEVTTASAGAGASAWTWVNLWATWCSSVRRGDGAARALAGRVLAGRDAGQLRARQHRRRRSARRSSRAWRSKGGARADPLAPVRAGSRPAARLARRRPGRDDPDPRARGRFRLATLRPGGRGPRAGLRGREGGPRGVTGGTRRVVVRRIPGSTPARLSPVERSAAHEEPLERRRRRAVPRRSRAARVHVAPARPRARAGPARRRKHVREARASGTWSGEEETILYVKGSGGISRRIEASGFSPVRMRAPPLARDAPGRSPTPTW